jgi:glycosyltransferase involved in cell wall biosynthesis
MNILLLANKLPWPAKDGGSLATLNMATGLANCGCKVTVLAVNTSKHFFPVDQIPENISARIRFRTATTDTGIRPLDLLRNLLFSRYPYNAERFISSEIINELVQLLDEQDFDVVQLEGPYLFYCVPVIRKRSRALVSLRAHNIEHEIWTRNASQTRNLFTRSYFRIMARRIKKLETDLFSDIDALIPISDRDASGFTASGICCPVHVATFGLEPKNYPVTDMPARLSLFFLGALDWRPNATGLDWFIKYTWPLVKERFPAMKFHIAGRNAAGYYRKKSHDPDIIINGEVEDAYQFMSGHTIMIVPLLSGSGIRIKILEGMALGRIIITTGTGLEGIAARDRQEVMVANDPVAFLSAITELAGNPGLLHSLSRHARQFVMENFDNFTICQGLAQFYNEPLKWSGKYSSG